MRGLIRIVLVAGLVASTGCLWRYSLKGGGLPDHIRNVAILPFENQTSATELQREIVDALRKGFSSRIGLRETAEDKASAVVRGTIVVYDVDAAVGFSANPAQATSARRRLRVQVDVEIFDQVRGRALWSKKSLVAEGDYAEGDEASGRKQAVDRIVNEVIEGALSQW